MKAFLRFLVVLCLPALVNLAAGGSLKVTLGPDQAPAAGALWRVDGGTWMKSGTVVNGLRSGSHSLDFQTVPGWIAPASFSVTLTDDDTTNASGVYVQGASVQATLKPSSAQWKVDDHPWVGSGTAVANLAPGNHAIRYQNVSGYQTPAMEIVNLAAGQAVAWDRSYVQAPQLRLMLLPPYARWRVDGGGWQDAGATVTDLAPGSHSVEYSRVSGFKSPPNETFTLTQAETVSQQRNYVQLAQITVTLSQPAAAWRIDGGAWQPNGGIVSDLVPGTHSLSFSRVNGYSPLPDETVSLNEGQVATVIRTYLRRSP
jgi:hypothetical protein